MDKDNCNIFQLAVMYRRENVFNLIYQMSGYTQAMVVISENYGNTILHLAGGLTPYDKLNLVLGAALQCNVSYNGLRMLNEVERFVAPHYKELPNKKDEIPSMVFTKEHKKLVKEGEKWMKDIANSGTIASTLIATIAFASNNATSGLIVFYKKMHFLSLSFQMQSLSSHLPHLY
ncbi:hypothetical protein HYC85_020489 [Camellia sinensis]|uniref:PGG domain-containing protein n=1 Tax=Camellia sinensis TaxID=4442 RepID=A0A7J7GQV6_CAMSI|nr:hypothetical protein HYC85_020489 [Camellia sinensis]